MDKKELYKRIWAKYGDFQMVIAIEECAELQKTMTKYIRHVIMFDCSVEKKQELLVHIYEEMADVEIMLEQLKTRFPSKMIAKHKREKIKRLESILNK